MTISQASINTIMILEETIHTRWVNRVLILCSDNDQCNDIHHVLSLLDYSVELIVLNDVYDERKRYYSSIEKLRNGTSKVLVTTPDTMSIIQKNMDTFLHFDVVL
jgi:superfamily II DNA/RNA helicase